MEQQNSEVNKALFSVWISDPSVISYADSKEVELLAGQFPYCQILQLLNAKSLQKQETSSFNHALERASLQSSNRRVLFNLVNHPERLAALELANEYKQDIYQEVIEQDYYGADLATDDSLESGQTQFGIDEELETDVKVENTELIEDEVSTEVSEQNPENFEIVQKTIPSAVIGQMDEEEMMIIGNIASSDFFAFEEKLDFRQTDATKENAEDKNEPAEEEHEYPAFTVESQSSAHEVARYDDDSMPYSFLWWLHKTRQEHAETYQPYVDFKLDDSQQIKKEPAKELNQQIIENIFHLQSPLEQMDNMLLPKTIHFDVRRKEEEIIEKFIREEPQIHPPSPDKVDIENKARKSAEDPNDLVSETLAGIYTEQMLFHKAIDTYKKLSLKFPEKRVYFADQISELQKKIN